MSAQEELERRLAWLVDALDRRGSDLERWPDAERDQARSLMGTTPRAGELVARARSVDALLSSLPAVDASASLRRRVAEIPLRRVHAGPLVSLRSLWPFASVSRAFALAAVLLSLGAALGLGVATSSAAADDVGWDDFGGLMLADALQTDPQTVEVAP